MKAKHPRTRAGLAVKKYLALAMARFDWEINR